jgi:two-component system nitrate/nitrite response regulator NarL
MSAVVSGGDLASRGDPVKRVCIAARVRMYREGLAQQLSRDHRFLIVATPHDWEGCLETARTARPDVIVLDLALADSARAIDALLEVTPGVRVIGLAVDSVEDALTCAEAGFAGYFTCDDSLEDLAERVDNVCRGEMPCAPEVVSRLLARLAELARWGAASDTAPSLTVREQEIARMVAGGLSNKQIATQLHIELATVKNHVHNVLQKFGVTRRRDVEVRIRATRMSDLSREI